MKTLLIALVIVVSFGLTTMAQKQVPSRNASTIAFVVSSESIPVRLSPFSCTCSCGKNCSGACSGHYSNCNALEALDCIAGCCADTPDPGPDDCQFF